MHAPCLGWAYLDMHICNGFGQESTGASLLFTLLSLESEPMQTAHSMVSGILDQTT